MSVPTLPATPATPLPRANGTPIRIADDPYAEGDGDRLFEVVRGKRVEKNMGLMQVYIAGILYRALAAHCDDRDLGHALIEAMFRLPADGNDRKPDVAFVTYGKWAKTRPIPEVNAWSVVPDLAVEVISPHDKAFEVLAKVHEYFDSGVQLVWQVYSVVQQVWVYTSPTAIRVLTNAEELNGDPVVPDFRMPVAKLFPPSEPLAN